ncbi:ATP-binding cassette domain-containing protein [Mycobacterium hubeiense]|uniref:ATP-binding cassette domain-containing protein n=1 Tax=Mycobacterium hubeiense TaxID=1867256 RepID=UPI000C7F4884|nr:ATP-binding cassette domain-containing protein [Mycobacterium sp. QGD 101]
MTRPASSEIRVTGLSKRFDPQPKVLDDVELTARGGGLALIVGAPGSGKSTLARCLTGVYRPDNGTVTYRLGSRGAVDLTAADARTVAWLRTHHIGSFDGLVAAPPRLPAAVAAARAARCSRSSAVAALGRFHIANLASVPIGRLRVSDRLAVSLAAALLSERPFVVLDEPERFADGEGLTRWLRRLTDDGAAVVATGSPGSPLHGIATATGELRRGKIQWRKP